MRAKKVWSSLIIFFFLEELRTTGNMNDAHYVHLGIPVCGVGEFIAVRVQDRDDVPIHSAQHFVTSVAKYINQRRHLESSLLERRLWGTWIFAGRGACSPACRSTQLLFQRWPILWKWFQGLECSVKNVFKFMSSKLNRNPIRLFLVLYNTKWLLPCS